MKKALFLLFVVSLSFNTFAQEFGLYAGLNNNVALLYSKNKIESYSTKYLPSYAIGAYCKTPLKKNKSIIFMLDYANNRNKFEIQGTDATGCSENIMTLNSNSHFINLNSLVS